jgi:hypothetical protein
MGRYSLVDRMTLESRSEKYNLVVSKQLGR